MKKVTIWKRWFLALLALMLLLPGLPGPALGAGLLDVDRETSLTVYFGRSGKGFPGVEFELYRVASVSPSAELTLTGAFADDPVSLDNLSTSGWWALAHTLEGYIIRDGRDPMRTAKAGQDGRVTFSGLPTGLYLVRGGQYQEGDRRYQADPFLLCLPNLEDDVWTYQVAASCKFSQYITPSPDDETSTVRRKVLKVWKDDGNEAQRPEEITVQLLKDNGVYDVVTLSEKNNWRYTWENLDKDATWRVVEYRTPEGYTVSVDREGITFVMTNTYQPETDIPDDDVPESDIPRPSEDPDGPTPEDRIPPSPDVDIPDDKIPEANIPDGPTPASDIPNERLPQTGVLWWPVPLLAVSGLFLFVIGWGYRRHEED